MQGFDPDFDLNQGSLDDEKKKLSTQTLNSRSENDMPNTKTTDSNIQLTLKRQPIYQHIPH